MGSGLRNDRFLDGPAIARAGMLLYQRGLLIALGGYHALGISLPLCTMAAVVLAWWPGMGQPSHR